MTRFSAHKILKEIFALNGLEGRSYATHSLRKTFAANVFKISGNNILAVSKLLGHSDVKMTMNYLSVNEDELFQFVVNQ